MAAKVAADLKRMQRFYGAPSNQWIADFEKELIIKLKGGYVDTATYGYRLDGNWISPTLRYTAQELGSVTANDDDPGRVQPGASIVGACFHAYMTHTAKWTSSVRQEVEPSLPFQRSIADEPGVSGYFSADRTYSAGGRALNRSSVRSF
jgi:hypothetical protein